MVYLSFWSANGKPISSEQFLNDLCGELPKLFIEFQEHLYQQGGAKAVSRDRVYF